MWVCEKCNKNIANDYNECWNCAKIEDVVEIDGVKYAPISNKETATSGGKKYKGGIPFAKTIVVTFAISPLILIILFWFGSLFVPEQSVSKPVDNSQSYSCSASDMKRLARERASRNGRVLYVNKISMGNFNYSAQFYPKNKTGRYEIWLKIECINGEAKVTDAESFKVD